MYDQISTLGCISSPVCGMHGTYFNEAYHSYSLPGPGDTGDIIKVMGPKVNICLKHFAGRGIPIDGSPSKTI